MMNFTRLAVIGSKQLVSNNQQERHLQSRGKSTPKFQRTIHYGRTVNRNSHTSQIALDQNRFFFQTSTSIAVNIPFPRIQARYCSTEQKVKTDKIKKHINSDTIDYTMDQLQEQFFMNLDVGNLNNLKKIIEKGFDVNACRRNSMAPWVYSPESALGQVVKKGNEEILQLLLDRGAEVDAQNYNQETPVDLAIENEKIVMLEVLLEYGADVNNVDSKNRTPLYKAADSNSVEMVNNLLKAGANPNVSDEWGLSPLHIAVDNDNIEMAEILLKKAGGVDPNAAPINCVACRSDRMEALLMEYKAEPSKAGMYRRIKRMF